ncbi:MAG TPA: signal peptidase I [Candidatus Paceibacterota bacterium]|nr:signal peptidase I [Candidatus Paceibacterota bacterium]
MKKIFWSFLEIFETVIIAVVAVVLIRTFITQPFLVSGSSMEPTFENGNYLLVDELAYRFREPERGEVVVFKDPINGSSFYIKRIIGLPGEKVVIDDGKVSVYKGDDLKRLEEGYVLNVNEREDYEKKLEKNEYFVMGDNRGFSFDSRNWGPLGENKIVGLVRFRLWPVSEAMAISKPAY